MNREEKKGRSGLTSLILCLCELVVGVLLFVSPVGFTSAIIMILGAVLVVVGVVDVVNYFRAAPLEAALGNKLTRGLLAIVFGLFCLLRSHWFIVTFPVLTILYGIAILISGLVKVQWAVDLARQKLPHWGWMALAAVVTLIFALVILLDPFTTAGVLWTFVAVALIVQAVLDLLTLIFGRVRKTPAPGGE